MDDTTARTRLERERERLLAVRGDLAAGRTADMTGPPSAPLLAADVASDVVEREVEDSILHQVDLELRDVEAALRRLADGSYGTCATCGVTLPPERLEAVPAARYCTEHESMWEGDRLALAVPAGRYEDGDAHTTDRMTAREAGQHLELVGDQDELTEPVEVAPEERALHLTDLAEPNPPALSAEQVTALTGRGAGGDGDEDERRVDRIDRGAPDDTDEEER